MPTCYNIALNYLPIQASPVLSEHVFSSSAETDTKKCNCINYMLMEASQMLKFTVRQSCLSFTKDWITSESTLLELDLDTSVDLASLMWEDADDYQQYHSGLCLHIGQSHWTQEHWHYLNISVPCITHSYLFIVLIPECFSCYMVMSAESWTFVLIHDIYFHHIVSCTQHTLFF